MKHKQKAEDPWQYATYEGTEHFQCQQTARMTLSERLQALDDMISLATGLSKKIKNDPDNSKLSRFAHDQ